MVFYHQNMIRRTLGLTWAISENEDATRIARPKESNDTELPESKIEPPYSSVSKDPSL